MPPTSLGRRPRPPGRYHSSTVSPPNPWTMSLLSNYEGLRHQIERLVHENEELKKLVRLIRENRELKSAIKTHASAMGISGINNMFNEEATAHAPRTSDRVIPSSAPAQNPGTDDIGILTSLAEILNNSQSSPSNSISTGPVCSSLAGPLTRPLNDTISGSMAVLPNSPLFSFVTGNLNNQLTDSMIVSPNSIQANALPYSTPAPLSSPAIASGTVPLADPNNDSVSTGPLSSSSNSAQIVSPMTNPTKSPLMDPSPPAASVGSPQTGSVAVPPISTLTSSLPGSLSAPMAVPPLSMFSSPVAVPPISMLSSSPPGSLGAPTAVPPTTSLSGTLIGSVSSPAGNVLPNPMVNNMLLIDPSQPLDATHHSSSSPPPSANIPASKVPIPTDNKKTVMDWKPSADVEPSNMAFVGQPIQTSIPIGTITVGTPITTFFGSPESLAQHNTSIPTMPSVLASVPIAGIIPTSALPITVATSSTQPTADAAPLHQGAPTSSTPNLNATFCKDIANKLQNSLAHTALTARASSLSPPHPSHSPPPHSIISSPPANHARRSHSLEHKNKSLLETERKTTHRKTSKVSEIQRDAKQLTWERLVGEIAFQLDRRILSSIFPERVRLYGFTVSNIPEKIIQASLNTSNHKLDEELCQTLTQRYVTVMNRLQSLGYNGRVHPGLTEQLVNAYGILRERPELAASEGGSYTMDFLQRVIIETVPQSVLTDALLLLSCLNQLSHDDGKPMFIW